MPGAKLPLVIAVGEKVYDGILASGMLHHVTEHSVDLCIAATTFLIGKMTRIAHSCHNEAMFDVSRLGFIETKPSD